MQRFSFLGFKDNPGALYPLPFPANKSNRAFLIFLGKHLSPQYKYERLQIRQAESIAREFIIHLNYEHFHIRKMGLLRALGVVIVMNSILGLAVHRQGGHVGEEQNWSHRQ